MTWVGNLHFFIKYSILSLVKLAVTPEYLEAHNMLHLFDQFF